MGIKGLHKALSFCTVKDNLRNYRNATIAVDTSSWMHKSVYSISEKFVEATNSGRLDEGCVRVSARYITTRCKELIEAYGIRAVYLVMDGERIPLKADESADRDQKRQQNLAEARRLKRSGERWKAEDKYKSCIRIKDNFTRAVIKEIKKELSHYDHVHFVYSPHEADSQLARLVLDGVAEAVITEDSDVLVYSAAAHVVFPILFKLDRKTGNCDRIKMDWLLSLTSEEAARPITSTNTLEVIFRRLAARQTKRKGFGVRLFVQGCILAGCDYRKNIEGIGTTNAFKLVRDNAFRNDSVRFRKILESLPKKVKQNIDINEYEEILAKSEAIFFYHPVLHTDGNIKPLLNPRLSPDECGDEHHFTDHYPFMSRFQGDWSFLGTTNTKSESNNNVKQPTSNDIFEKREKPVGPTELPKASPWVQTKERDRSQAFSSTQSQIIQNPYKKSKPCDRKGIFPLVERNVNSRISPENKSGAKRQPISQKGSGDITRYFVKPDVRYVRRSFPSTTRTTIKAIHEKRPLSAAGLSFRISAPSLPSTKSPAQSFFLPRSSKNERNTISMKYSSDESVWPKYDPNLYTTTDESTFSYPPLDRSDSTERVLLTDKGTENTSFNDIGDEFQNSALQDFYDLTSSNPCASDDADLGATNGTRRSKYAAQKDSPICAVPLESDSTVVNTVDKNSGENLEQSFCADQYRETEKDGRMTSKYFPKKSGSRRVTLDSVRSPFYSETPGDVCETSKVPKPIGYAISGSQKRKSGSRGSLETSYLPNSWMSNFVSRRKRSKDKNAPP